MLRESQIVRIVRASSVDTQKEEKDLENRHLHA